MFHTNHLVRVCTLLCKQICTKSQSANPWHCKNKLVVFNHKVVALVADKLKRQWLLEVYFDVED